MCCGWACVRSFLSIGGRLLCLTLRDNVFPRPLIDLLRGARGFLDEFREIFCFFASTFIFVLGFFSVVVGCNVFVARRDNLDEVSDLGQEIFSNLISVSRDDETLRAFGLRDKTDFRDFFFNICNFFRSRFVRLAEGRGDGLLLLLASSTVLFAIVFNNLSLFRSNRALRAASRRYVSMLFAFSQEALRFFGFARGTSVISLNKACNWSL